MICTRFLLIAAAVVLPPATTYAGAPDTPAPITALKQRGFEIKGTLGIQIKWLMSYLEII